MNRKNPRNGQPTTASTADKSVAIIGAGGTIGSYLIPHVARMKEVRKVILVEPDRYEPHNLLSQEIEARDIGRLKVEVQALRLKRIDPLKTVRKYAERVENVPLGELRCDVVLSCLDSRKPRMVVNETAARLGIPWLDAGIGGEEQIARVNGYGPGTEFACMECTWNDDDYNAVEQTYPCDSGVNQVSPTNSPSHLGALAAAIQAAECEKLVSNQGEPTLLGRQIVVDMRNLGQIVSRICRNPDCRFDHHVWEISPLEISSSRTRIHEIFEEIGESETDLENASLELAGHSFVQTLVCRSCHRKTPRRLRIVRRLGARELKCSVCKRELVARGFDQFERVAMQQLSGPELRRSLRSIGFREGDVLQIFSSDDSHRVELKSTHAKQGSK